jgi:hypothetical protein
MIAEAMPTRACVRCFEEYPETRFRRRRKGSDYRHCECNTCHAAAMQLRRAKAKGRAFTKLAQNINRARTPAEILARFGPTLVLGLGGVDDFLASWLEHIATAGQERPGGRDVLNSCRAIIRLWEFSATYGAQEPRREADDGDLAKMTLEEIDKELNALIRRALGDDYVADDLRSRGWTVIAPQQASEIGKSRNAAPCARGHQGPRCRSIATDCPSRLTLAARTRMLTQACPTHPSVICAHYADAHSRNVQ